MEKGNRTYEKGETRSIGRYKYEFQAGGWWIRVGKIIDRERTWPPQRRSKR